MRIRPAEDTDLNAVAQSYRNLLMHEMENNGFSNWQFGVYPTTEVSVHAHAKRELFVAEIQGRITGSMILTSRQPKEYKNISWNCPDAKKILVVHTLCVPPRHSGKGYGHAMIRYALEWAEDQKYDVVRCNFWEKNAPAKHVLEDMGFQICGTARFLPASLPEETDHFMEYNLKQQKQMY